LSRVRFLPSGFHQELYICSVKFLDFFQKVNRTD
jgi:hypothetical protein